MSKKIGVLLALDGEKQFTQGLKNAQTSAKALKSDLSGLASEYKSNANSLEYLTKRQEKMKDAQTAYERVLSQAKNGRSNALQQLNRQKDALQDLEKQLEKAREAQRQMEASGDRSSAAYKDQARAIEDLEEAVKAQNTEYLRAEGRMTSWDLKVSQAERSVRETSKAIEQNEKYMQEAEKATDRCATSIDKFGKETDDAKSSVQELGVGLGTMIKAKAVDLAGDAMRELGRKALEAARYVIEVGSSFEKAMSEVEAISGATGSELDSMSQKAQELGSSTKFSATEVAEGFKYMSLAGWSTHEMLSGIDGVVSLAAASEMDLASASDMLTDYLSAFGLAASDAGMMADQMAYAQANSNTTVEMLGESFGNCAANMHAAGQDMETTTSFLEAMANQGRKGAQAGTTLSAIMRDLTAKMKDGKVQIGDTAVAVQDSEGNFRDLTDIMRDVEAATEGMGTAQKTSALSATFTSRSIAGVNMILTEGVDKIAGYEEKLRSADGTAASMADTMQNNLQGAITEMNSAAEGLGIALYDKVKGPLTDAVRLATDLISGITEVITPEKDALTSFIEEIEQSNKAVEESIEHARATIEGGKEKAAEITAYQGEISNILTACEEFNAITLEDGKTAIVNASGEIVTSFTSIDEQANSTDEILAQFASDGLNTEAISFSSSEAREMIGYVEDKVESVETRLSSFASDGIDTSKVTEGKNAIVELFSEAGEKVGEVEAAISDTGKIEMDTGNIEAGTQVVITGFDDSTQSVQTFKGSIEDLSAVGFDFSGMTEQFSQVEDAVTRTYHITDEFTKVKIDTMVNSLGDAVSGLAQAWDSSTGSLTANREELEDWFDTAKQVAMYNALQDAISEMYSAWGTSAVNVAKAQSALKAAQDDLTEANERNSQSLDYLNGGFGEYYDEVLAAELAVEDAEKALKKANETYQESDEELRQNADALQELKGVLDESAVAEDNVKESVDAATDSLEEFEESEENAAQAAYEAQKEIAQAHKDAADDIVDAYDSAKQAAENAFSVNPFDEWSQNAENGIEKMQSAFDSQIEGMENYASNLKTVSEHVGKEITPEFLHYLESLGMEGAQAVEELATAFENNDTETIDALMNSYVEAMKKQDEIASAIAADNVAFQLGLGELSFTAQEWEGLEAAVDYVQEAGGKVSSETEKAFQKAAKTAKECGVKIPESLKEGIENGAKDPEGAIIAATDQINAAIQGRAEGLLQTARAAGIPIPSAIADGISEGGDAAVEAYQQLVSMIAAENTSEAEEAGKETGNKISGSVSEGIAENQSEAESAATEVMEAASVSMIAAEGKFSDAGMNVASAFAKGIRFMQDVADAAGEELAEGAHSGAVSVEGEFSSAGETAGQNYTSGVESQTGNAYSAGQSVASSAKEGAESVSGWDSIGANIASGVASGILSNASRVATAAAQMVRDAMNAAKAEGEIASPSKKFKRMIGKQISAGTAMGITQNTGLVTDAAQAQMDQTLYALSTWLSKNKKKIKKSGSEFSEAVSYSWQKLAETQLKGGFGISKTETTGSGKNQKTEAKSTEKYYSEVFSAAGKYLSNVKKLYNISTEDEAAYWKNVKKNLKAGTQAWYDAKEKITSANKSVNDVIISDTEKTISKKRILGKITAQEEADLWAGIRKQVKKGSDAWYEATEKMKEAKAQAKEDLKAANAKILSDAQTYVADKKANDEMSVKDEIAYWGSVLKTVKKGSDEYKTILANIKELKAQVGTVAVAEDLLGNYQTYYDMSERAQMQYWDEIRKNYKVGTAERIQADKHYLTARESYEKNLKKLDEDYAQNEKKLREDAAAEEKKLKEDLAKKTLDITKKRDESIAKSQKKLSDTIKNINEKLAKDIQSANEKLASSIDSVNKKYADAVENRKKQIASSFDLFAEFESKSASGKALLYNLKTQAAGYKDWAEELQRLKDRGVLNDDLIKELSEKGPSDSAAVHALNMLSDEELKEYDQAYNDKMALAAQQATIDNSELLAETNKQIEQLRKESAAEIEQLKSDAKAEIDKETQEINEEIRELNTTAQAEINELQTATQTELQSLKAETTKSLTDLKTTYTTERAALTASINSDILNLAKNISTIASDMTSALVKSFTSAAGLKAGAETTVKTTPVTNTTPTKTTTPATTPTSAVTPAKTATAAATATSAATASAAKAAEEALKKAAAKEQEKALKNSLKTVIQTGKKRSNKLTKEEEKYNDLFKYIVTKYGREPSTDMYRRLASLLGVKVTKNVDKLPEAERKKILAALKQKGMSKGTRSLDDFFAWMDENGIGSEMVVRKSDGARLNTAVRPGDAIIPAKNTDNLWEWSKTSPEQILAGLEKQQAALASYAQELSNTVQMSVLNRKMAEGYRAEAANPSIGHSEEMMEQMLTLMERFLPFMAERVKVSLDPKEVARETSGYASTIFAMNTRRRRG